MRYYLDTNILIFLFNEQEDDLSYDVSAMLDDYSNVLLTSAVCVQELIHIIQIGKVKIRKRQMNVTDVVPWLHKMDITIVQANELHLKTLAELPIIADHRDPADRLIVAQAIADRVPVISSDHKFRLYERHGLEFVYNKR